MNAVRRADRQAGFTLLELLVVMVIIGLLAGFVAPRYFAQVGKSQVKAARAQIDALDKALEQFRIDVGHLPDHRAGARGAEHAAARGAELGRALPQEGGAARSLGQRLPLRRTRHAQQRLRPDVLRQGRSRRRYRRRRRPHELVNHALSRQGDGRRAGRRVHLLDAVDEADARRQLAGSRPGLHRHRARTRPEFRPRQRPAAAGHLQPRTRGPARGRACRWSSRSKRWRKRKRARRSGARSSRCWPACVRARRSARRWPSTRRASRRCTSPPCARASAAARCARR